MSRRKSLALLGLYGLTPWLAAMGLAALLYPELAG
mgnify:CR=1 FL=1